MKIGVLGGTFDPVHLGHIMMAGEAIKVMGIAEVLLVPAGQPMSKNKDNLITTAEHRLEMLRLAIEGKPELKISTIEMDRPGPSYTVDTLTELKKRYAVGDEIYFILGWDSLEYLHQWHQPDKIIKSCTLVAIPRPGYDRPNLNEMEKIVPGITSRVVFLEKPRVDISASAVRELAARGKPIGHLVPDAVADYIQKHELYMAN